MGATGSQPRRNSQYMGNPQDIPPPPPAPVYAPSSGYQSGYGGDPYALYPFQHQYPTQPVGWHASGPQATQYYPGHRPGPYMGPLPAALIPRSTHMVEPEKTMTIQNDVNLKRSSVKLHADPNHDGHFLVSFAFDATVAGSFCIFFVVHEGDACSLTPVHPHLYTPVRVRFAKGLNQKYTQDSGSGVNLRSFEEAELLTTTPGAPYPLVIRSETAPKSAPPHAEGAHSDIPGAKVPKWIQCQTTYAALVTHGEGEYRAKVSKQKIWVDGMRYELQEIYGMDSHSATSSGSTAEGSVSAQQGEGGRSEAKECVICLSEPRNTTVLPCRHMCMCSNCASVLQYQSNKCPICRQPVDRLLEIRVSDQDEVEEEGLVPSGDSPLEEGAVGKATKIDSNEVDLGKLVFGSTGGGV